MMRIVGVSMALLATLLAACDNKTQASSAPSSAASTGAAGAGPAASATGLHAPNNDRAVVALAEQVLGCPRGNAAFERSCPAFQRWQQSPLFADGKADETLVRMLADERAEVRYLAADRLRHHGDTYRRDPRLARQVLTAALGETSPVAGVALGAAVGGIDAAKTALAPRIEQLMEDAKLPELRRSLVATVLVRNPSFYDRIARLAQHDPDATIRLAAVTAFWAGTPPAKQPQTCALWLDRATEDADPNTAGEAAHLCALYPQDGGCQDQWTDLLAAIEQKAKAGEVKSSQMAGALANLYGHEGTSPAQKKRALRVARTMVDNGDNGEQARARALQLLAERDPRGKALAQKLVNDAHPAVKAAAERIVGTAGGPPDAGG